MLGHYICYIVNQKIAMQHNVRQCDARQHKNRLVLYLCIDCDNDHVVVLDKNVYVSSLGKEYSF